LDRQYPWSLRSDRAILCVRTRRIRLKQIKARQPGQRYAPQSADLVNRVLEAVGKKTRALDVSDVRRIAGILQSIIDAHEQAPPLLTRELQRIERKYRFTSAAGSLFQNMLGKLGIDSNFEIRIPVDDKPYWMRVDHRLTTYRSRPKLPAAADVVIIGAGLTGASAAYYLRDAARQGLRVVVLDKGAPASEASGRNGGNFELLPENSVGIYEGLASERLAFLHRRYPAVPIQILRAESERQASIVLGVALRNRNCMKHIIEGENIDCDFSPKGWLYLAHTENEEQAICDEVLLAAEQRQKIEIWSRMKIRNEFGFDRGHIGRFVPGDGSYHPFKFVYGVLERCLESGVELYTGIGVREVRSLNAASHSVTTDEGAIVVGRVIVAANAFISQIFPELTAIRAAQSQIAVTEFVPDRCRGRIITSEEGPVYFHQPRTDANHGVAPLLMGGGADRPTERPSSRRRNAKIHAKLLGLRELFFPELRNRPYSTEWVGVCGFTPDQLPVVGFLRPGIVIAGAFNGYGGSYCCLFGQVAATMAVSGQGPEWLPDDVFSPKRLLTGSPLFMSGTDGPWRIASALCAQLQAVNRQISDAISFSGKPIRSSAASHFVSRLSDAKSTLASGFDARVLRSLPAFSEFTPAESKLLVAEMSRWDLPAGALLFSHGSPGSSCFIVLSGAVAVSMQVHGRERLLSTLHPGSIFGQIALIDGSPRSATCATVERSVLLELEQDACKRLFASGSAAAFKFLAALNQGLIEALRGANRQLMRLTVEDRAPWPASVGVERGRRWIDEDGGPDSQLAARHAAGK
jgi:glycine/D-amino acid oxidase-like deaminating enzyme/CRP-like cAMP-binding protein